MKMNQILSTIRSLSVSQGFYGRLLHGIEEMKRNDIDAYEKYAEYLEAQNFGDDVDLVMFFEC